MNELLSIHMDIAITDSTRKLIFDSAARIFSEKGFRAASIAEIAEAARIAVGSFYKYFESKVALFLEIFAQRNLQTEKAILSSTQDNSDTRVYVTALVFKLIEAIKADPILRIWREREL